MTEPGESAHAKRPHRFFAVPSTMAGRASATLLLVAVLLVALEATVVDALMLRGSGEVLDVVVRAGIGLSLLAAPIAGAIAFVRKAERSWLVWLSTALPLIVLSFEVVSMIVGDE